MKKIHVKKGDTAVVVSGANKGDKGEVLQVSPKTGKVIVEGTNMVTRHVKPRSANEKGGRIEKEGPMNASKVMLYCDKCKKATRIGYKLLSDGKKARVCKKCGETFES